MLINSFNFSFEHRLFLQYHKNDLDALLGSLKVKFDVIAILDTRLSKGIELVHDINLANYEK